MRDRTWSEPSPAGVTIGEEPQPGLQAAGSVYVLDVDPDLALGLPPEHFEAARARSRAITISCEGPGWDPSTVCRLAEPGWLGLLMIEGVMIRCVSVGSRTACEFYGPGDVIRPWDADGQYEPLQIELTWRVTRRSRLAVLDTRFGARIGGWPTIVSCLMSRVASRARALALNHAVSHLPRVDSRLLIVFWLLAERWGKMTADPIPIPLPLTHEVLAMLVGTRRPTVTLSLQRLAQADLIIRERRDQWLLTSAATDYLNDPTGRSLEQIPAIDDLRL